MSSNSSQFAALLEAMPDALVAVDHTGVIRFVNHQAESLFGYDRDDLVDAPLEILVPESVRTVHKMHREDYAAAPFIRTMGQGLELYGKRRDGIPFPVDIALCQTDIDGDPLVIAAVRDITDLKKAEESRRHSDRLAAIVEHSDDAILSKTLDGVITSWNPAAQSLYGYCSEEIIGRPVTLLSPKDRAGEIEAILAKIRAGQHVEHLETTRVRKDGTTFPVLLTVSPIRDSRGGAIGASTIAHDVTSQRRDRAEIAEHQTRALERLEELERFQRLTVGRELKMIELKNENTRLADEVSRLAATAPTPAWPAPGTQAGQAATSEYVGALLNLLEDATAQNTRLKSRLDGAA
jgi:PAS domain S-box-containing protein